MTSVARLRNKSLLFMIIDIDDLNFMGEESSSRLQTQYDTVPYTAVLRSKKK